MITIWSWMFSKANNFSSQLNSLALGRTPPFVLGALQVVSNVITSFIIEIPWKKTDRNVCTLEKSVIFFKTFL